MKRVISILLILVVMTTMFVLPTSAASYPIGSIYNPMKITFGENYDGGWNGSNDHLNYYITFKTNEKGLVTFDFTKPYDSEGEIGEIEFYLYDSEGNCIWLHTSAYEKDTPKPTTSYTVGLEAGEYHMNVVPGFYVTSGYIDFSYNFSFKATEYCEAEPNNTIAEATYMNLGYFYKGFYGTSSFYEEGSDEYDFLKFYVTKGNRYRVRFKNVKKLKASTALVPVIMNGEEIDSNVLFDIENRCDNEGCFYTDFVAPSTGYAYLKFDNYFGTPIEYDVEISEAVTKCSKPSLKKIQNTADGVKITWGKVSGADKYYVYRKTGSNGKYSKIATVKGNSKVTYTAKKAKSGKKYYYYVKAVNEAGCSSASKSKSILYLADTTLKTPSSTKKGIVLKWSKVTGAEGYQVYRKTGSGSYEKIATVKGSTKVPYTDKKAKKGKTYTYKIRAYKSKTTSAYSNAKKIKDKY